MARRSMGLIRKALWFGQYRFDAAPRWLGVNQQVIWNKTSLDGFCRSNYEPHQSALIQLESQYRRYCVMAAVRQTGCDKLVAPINEAKGTPVHQYLLRAYNFLVKSLCNNPTSSTTSRGSCTGVDAATGLCAMKFRCTKRHATARRVNCTGAG